MIRKKFLMLLCIVLVPPGHSNLPEKLEKSI